MVNAPAQFKQGGVHAGDFVPDDQHRLPGGVEVAPGVGDVAGVFSLLKRDDIPSFRFQPFCQFHRVFVIRPCDEFFRPQRGLFYGVVFGGWRDAAQIRV